MAKSKNKTTDETSENQETENITEENVNKNEEENKMANKDEMRCSFDKKVRIVVAKDPLNPRDNFVTCTINGKNYQIKREVAVEVPEIVAFYLKEAGIIADY